jgi:uncharacterized protein DUF2442
MKSKSMGRGKGTFDAEVTVVSDRGITVRLGRKEHFLDYSEFPWFKGAPRMHVLNIRRPSEEHLVWPDLEVELVLDSVLSPERYPLNSNPSHTEPNSRTRPRKKGRL